MEAKNTSSSGFSLIELMVVIAIVAILAAVAIPAYNQYIQKAKLTKVSNIVYGIADQSKTYYNVHGDFPILKDLGYATDPGDDTISPSATTINSFSDYMPNVSVFSGGATCKTGTTAFYFAGTNGDNTIPDYMPLSSGTGTNYDGSGTGGVITVDVNGTISTYCFYQIYDNNNVFASGDVMKGCVNITDNPSYTTELDAIFNSC